MGSIDNKFESDDESDYEGTQTSILKLGDYKLHLKKSWPEYESITWINSSLKNPVNASIGSMTAYLFNRGRWGNMQFWTDCDAVTQETNDIAWLFTKQDGRLKYEEIEGLDIDTDKQVSSRGGFLVIEEVKIVKKDRGKDLSLKMIDALLDHLGSSWTIAWMAPFTLSSDTRNQSTEEISAGNIALARHFARLGFRQASIQECSQSKFWYLIPSRRTRKAKEDVQNLPVVQMKWLDEPAEKETSNVVSAVLAPVNCKADHLESITQSLTAGEDINQTEALFYAIVNDKLDVVQHLLKLGADVSYKNKYGATPLHFAAEVLKVKMCQLLLSHGANKEALNATGKTPFEVAIAEIENHNKLVATFNLNYIRVRRFWERGHKLVVLHLLATKPFQLIEGVLSPRMFYKLKVAVELAADLCYEDMPAYQNNVPISREDARCDVHLLSYVPEKEVPTEVFKSYAYGWQQQLQAIANIMGRGLLPTKRRVQEELQTNGSDSRYNSYYSKNGGNLYYALLAVVGSARDASETEGDGSFEEVFKDELTKIMVMKLLDDDFLFTKYFFVSFCVTPGASVVVPDVIVVSSARQPPAPASDRTAPCGVKRAATGFSSPERKTKKTLP